MRLLAGAKRRVGEQLGGDPLILADAAETRNCVLLSSSTLFGQVVFALTGAAWVDPIAGFIIALFAIKEGREAWEGEAGLTAHRIKDFWQHRTRYVANTRWWPPFCATTDWVAAAILAAAIAIGADLG